MYLQIAIGMLASHSCPMATPTSAQAMG